MQNAVTFLLLNGYINLSSGEDFMKFLSSFTFLIIFNLSLHTAQATQVLCECKYENCKSVSFELKKEVGNKVYMVADLHDSSLEGYVTIRRLSDKNIYLLDNLLLVEDFKNGFKLPGKERECKIIQN